MNTVQHKCVFLLKTFESLAFLTVFALFPASVWAGGVHVSDGDSLRIDGERIRLWGIDAPELSQKCEKMGVAYDCGITARDALVRQIGDTPISCETVNTDRYGRTVARCFVCGKDLGGLMVRQGWALDYERYSRGHYKRDQEYA